MITIAYTVHTKNALTEDMKQAIRNSSAFIMEFPIQLDKSYLKELEKRWNLVSRGEILPEESGLGGPSPHYLYDILHSVHKSNAKCYEERSPVSEQVDKEEDWLKEEATRQFTYGNFGKSLELATKHFKLSATNKIKRDESLTNFLANIQKDTNGDVTTIRGGTHTLLYHRLKNDFPDTKSIFPYEPVIYPFPVEVERRHIFGKEANREMIMRGIIYKLVSNSFDLGYRDLQGYRESCQKLNQILEGLKLNDIENLCKHLKTNWWRELGNLSLHETVRDWFSNA